MVTVGDLLHHTRVIGIPHTLHSRGILEVPYQKIKCFMGYCTFGFGYVLYIITFCILVMNM